MTIAETYARISDKEFMEWMAFDRLDPIGPDRGDLHAGIIASTVANVNRGKDSQPFDAADFMPEFGPKRKQDENEMLRNLGLALGVKP